MTGPEIIASFKQYYDRITSFSAPGYTDTEILLFLNNAQDELIQRRVFGKNFQPPRFEEIEKRVADLFSIVRVVDVNSGITASTSYGNSWYCAKTGVASGRVLYTIRLDARVSRTRPTLTSEYTRCRKIKTENAGRFTVSAANKTHFIHPRYLEEQEGYFIIGDYYTTNIDRVKLNVILKPYPITATISDFDNNYNSSYMSLPPWVHQEIVDIAVEKAMLTTGDQRWQAKVAENNQNTE